MRTVKATIRKTKPNIDEDKMKEYKQKWYDKKKETLRADAKERVMCQCGIEICKGAYTRHLKSIHHQNYEKSLNQK